MTMFIAKLIKDCMTGPDGLTFDPARVVGYPMSIAGFCVFFYASIKSVLATHAFDYVAFGTGFAAMMGGLLLVAGSVAAKNHTEPKDSPPKE